jgi:hypothetical protein
MSFRSSAQAEDFDLLARMDVRYMLGSRINQASWEVRSGSLAEVTRFYSITSSARTSSVGGTVIPIERAVFRFMDSLIRVGS